MKLAIDPRPFPLLMTGARIAVLGYGPSAMQHALGLRDAGNLVSIGMRSGGRSWARALRDGFTPSPTRSVIAGAGVVAVMVPDDEQAQVYWHAIEPTIDPGALLVFGRALALGTKVFEPRGVDVVLVAADDRSRRVAVHTDATGRALERAIAYARAAFGAGVAITTTTTAAEVDAALAELEARAGGAAALRAAVDTATSRARDSHAPDEAQILYCEGLRELVEQRARRGGAGEGLQELEDRARRGEPGKGRRELEDRTGRGGPGKGPRDIEDRARRREPGERLRELEDRTQRAGSGEVGRGSPLALVAGAAGAAGGRAGRGKP